MPHFSVDRHSLLHLLIFISTHSPLPCFASAFIPRNSCLYKGRTRLNGQGESYMYWTLDASGEEAGEKHTGDDNDPVPGPPSSALGEKGDEEVGNSGS